MRAALGHFPDAAVAPVHVYRFASTPRRVAAAFDAIAAGRALLLLPVSARVTPHRGQGESLVPLYTRESVSLSLRWLGESKHIVAHVKMA